MRKMPKNTNTKSSASSARRAGQSHTGQNRTGQSRSAQKTTPALLSKSTRAKHGAPALPRSRRLSAAAAQKVAATSKSLSRATATQTESKAKMSRHSARHIFGWAERTLIGIVVATIGCVGAAFAFELTYDPYTPAKQALFTLAEQYYTNHYYPEYLDLDSADITTILADYHETGLPLVRLRQLLLSDMELYEQYASAFDNANYTCNLNNSVVRYYPLEPYGPHDYRIDSQLNCQMVDN